MDVKTLCAGALAAGVLCGAPLAALAAVHAGHGSHGVRVPLHALSRPGMPHAATASFGSAHPSAVARALEASQAAGFGASAGEPLTDRSYMPGKTPFADRPWIEGYQPLREDQLFHETYKVLPSHNVLKVYVADTDRFSAAGIRFSARVPHTGRDLTAAEMEHESVLLLRTAFDSFPDLQTVDVWGTIPVQTSQLTTVDSTVFSVSADRTTYLAIRDHPMSDEEFLASFGRIWLAPQVPQ